MTDYLACRFPCEVCSWMEGEQTPAWIAKILALLAQEPAPEPLIALLSADEWTTSAEMALIAGTSPQRVRDRLRAARQRGAPVEGRRSFGYRLTGPCLAGQGGSGGDAG